MPYKASRVTSYYYVTTRTYLHHASYGVQSAFLLFLGFVPVNWLIANAAHLFVLCESQLAYGQLSVLPGCPSHHSHSQAIWCSVEISTTYATMQIYYSIIINGINSTSDCSVALGLSS